MGGSSSKNAFVDIVSQLLQEDIPGTDHDFWDELWKTPLTVTVCENIYDTRFTV